jgi:5-methylcytosine-specific restriction enzyme A
MAARAPKPCIHPGCAALIYSGGSRCERHEKLRKRASDQQRKRDGQELYGYRWRQRRAAFLMSRPLCECDECRSSGRVLAAEVVDHITPHQGDPALFWDETNWQPMSKRCHDRKTATIDGGYGNRRGGGQNV